MSYAKVNGLVQRPGIDHDPIKPWQWATIPGRADPVEIVSYPVPAEGRGDSIDELSTIMVRMVVGDPCSLVELPLRVVACFAPSRHEWSARPVHRFSDNPSAFVFTDEKPGNACAAILTDVRLGAKS
jgi:hypothetical protein